MSERAAYWRDWYRSRPKTYKDKQNARKRKKYHCEKAKEQARAHHYYETHKLEINEKDGEQQWRWRMHNKLVPELDQEIADAGLSLVGHSWFHSNLYIFELGGHKMWETLTDSLPEW